MLLLLSLALAAEDDLLVVEAVHDETADAVSTRSLDRDDLDALPARSTDDILRAMPGLHLSAHGGHGKAYQYFLRGFDAVHGGDLAIDVEGVPLNEPSNVHANGYLDLHAIPTALVHHVDLRPGTWNADVGAYGIAGSASFALGLAETGGSATVGLSTDLGAEATLTWRPRKAAEGTFLVLDGTTGEGVGDGRDWRQLRAALGWEGDLGGLHARAWALAYDGTFGSPGVLRAEDVEAGAIGFYGSYGEPQGGRSRRLLAGASLGGGDRLPWSVSAWGGVRSLALTQNYTGWYEDADHSDAVTQLHDALETGFRSRVGVPLSSAWSARLGLDGRATTLELTEVPPSTENAVVTGNQAQLAGWSDVTWRPARGVQFTPGLRAELFAVGSAWAPVFAPKLEAALFTEGPVQLVFDAGRGYRTPDLRGISAGRAPVAKADSAELGLRATLGRLTLRGAAFGTWVGDEIVFEPTTATYEATGSTRRIGFDGGFDLHPDERLLLQADVTVSDARWTADDMLVPYAPRVLVKAGAFLSDQPLGPGTLTAGLRGWYLGERPLPGGFAADPAVSIDLTGGYTLADWTLGVEVDNVLGTQWKDGSFLFASRWDPNVPLEERPVEHFTAGAPRVARLTLTRRF